MVYKKTKKRYINSKKTKRKNKKIPLYKYKNYKNKNNINKLVISVDNEIGKKRRKKLNYKFIHLKAITNAPDYIKNNFKFYHTENINSKKSKGRMACFASHIKALEYIVNNKLNNIVVLEDDAFLDGNIIGKLPQDGATLLAGIIRDPNKWSNDVNFRKNKVKNIIKNFKKGVNIIDYDKFRWSGAYSIYYPNWKIAKNNLEFIKNSETKYKHYDIYLANNKLVKYLHYPSIFTHDDRESVTQVSTKNNGYIKNYVL